MLTVGDTFTENFNVSDDIYTGFIGLFQDTNPLHINHQFAIDKGFQGVVMHGNILNGFLSYFIGECLPTKEVVIHTQEIQYKNAVYLNDTLHFTAVVVGFYESVNAIEFKFEFKNTVAKTVAKGKIQIGLLS